MAAVAMRAASCRAVAIASIATDSRRPLATARTHRPSVCQRPLWLAPTIDQGLMRRRTSLADSPSSPHSANANVIAHAEYRRRGATPRGTTVMHVSQARHR